MRYRLSAPLYIESHTYLAAQVQHEEVFGKCHALGIGDYDLGSRIELFLR